jgi:CHAT domain-containing protein
LSILDYKEQALKCFLLLFIVEQKLRYEFFSLSAKQQQQKESRRWVEAAIETAYQLWKSNGKKEYAEKVFLIAEKSKARVLLDEITSSLYYNRISRKDSLLQKQWEIQQSVNFYEREAILLRDKNGQEDSVKKELRYELSLVQKQVKEKYPIQENYQLEEQTSVDSLLQKISPNATIIEFFTGENGIYIIEAEKGNVQQIIKLENAERIQQSVKDFVFKWFEHGPEKMINDPEGYYTHAYEIYQWLWPEKTIGKKDRCIVIPDGIIGYLPFEALVIDSKYRARVDQWPFLIRNTNLYYSYSLQTLQQLHRNEKNNELFAGFFISFDNSQQASIPAVRKEYDAIRKVVSGDFFIEHEASLKEFNDHLGEVNVLHISTHSFLQGKENMPVLQLADNKFFLFELYGRAFQPQLVVLSACRTGAGMLAEGEGVISLARGFTATGANGIVAGLWNMNDESTAKLMGTFYHQLNINHQPADALRESKLQWLQQPNEQKIQKLPYFWAGLIYYGDNEPVYIKNKTAATKIWWIVAAIVAGLIFFLGRGSRHGNKNGH